MFVTLELLPQLFICVCVCVCLWVSQWFRINLCVFKGVCVCVFEGVCSCVSFWSATGGGSMGAYYWQDSIIYLAVFLTDSKNTLFWDSLFFFSVPSTAPQCCDVDEQEHS